MDAPVGRSFSIEPIGYVRTASRHKFDAPSQPDLASSDTNRIELLPGKQFELALQDLTGFDKIWIVSWFDRNFHWRPRVMPPRGPAKRRGVFATRSPHRPNPIGLTCVSLIRIEGLSIEVGPLDLLDGTPVLDLKPYLRTVDAHPEASLGWIEPIEAAEQEAPPYRVQVGPQAAIELAWLWEHWNIDFTDRAFGILQRDPTPHRTRRILQIDENRFRIACGPWRMVYRIDANTVFIEELSPGYSREALLLHSADRVLDGHALIAFADWKKAARNEPPEI